jgi:hypothetical protein
MQRYLNYWSTTLTVAATAEAVQLSVPPADAALLIGLGTGDHYLPTLAERDPLTGVELRREIVRCTAVAGGLLEVVRAQESTLAQVWDAGSLIEIRLTAGGLEALRDAGGGAVESVEAGEGVVVDSSDPAAPVVALSAATQALLVALASKVAALEAAVAGLMPPDSIQVTAARVDGEPGFYQVGYILEVPGEVIGFGSIFPADVDIPGIGAVNVTMVMINQMDVSAEFYVALAGDLTASLGVFDTLQVAGVGNLEFSAADLGVFYNAATDATEVGWTISTHDWDAGVSRVVTFTFAP